MALEDWDRPLPDENFKELKEKVIRCWELYVFKEYDHQDYRNEKLLRINSIKNDGDAWALTNMLHAVIRWGPLWDSLSVGTKRLMWWAYEPDVPEFMMSNTDIYRTDPLGG